MSHTEESLRKIRTIQIKANHHVDDLFAGMYQSVFKGRGIEFEEVKEYQQGDDIRVIDWNVSAKMGKLFVKNFREERELTVMLVVDVSASSLFGHGLHLKSERMAEIAAILAFSAIKNHDKVGLILFSDQVELYLPPKKGVRHVLRVIRELLYFKPKNKGTSLEKALNFLGKVQRKKTICFIISDFMAPTYEKEWSLNAQLHEIIAIHVVDDFEQNFPQMGLVYLEDLESGEICLGQTSSDSFSALISKQFNDKTAQLKAVSAKNGIEWLTIKTDSSYLNTLKSFFRRRERK